jgi:hypothetical protein
VFNVRPSLRAALLAGYLCCTPASAGCAAFCASLSVDAQRAESVCGYIPGTSSTQNLRWVVSRLASATYEGGASVTETRTIADSGQGLCIEAGAKLDPMMNVSWSCEGGATAATPLRR